MTDNTVRKIAADLPDLESYWMPFTGNRYFKENPRMISRADGMYCYTHDGRKLLDAVAGLWCCNAGHCHPKIVEAIKEQAETLDYAMAFQLGHPRVFELANKLTSIAPEGIDYAFFVNSGSEAVDTALKMALAYHRIRGQGERTRLIGREKGVELARKRAEELSRMAEHVQLSESDDFQDVFAEAMIFPAGG